MASTAEHNERSRMISRTKILDAAVALFDENGVAGSSVAEITRRAGVAHGLLNYHFASKDGLTSAVIDLWIEKRYAVTASQGEGDDLLADFIDDTFIATSDALPLQRVVAAMKLQPHTHRLFAEAEARHSEQAIKAEDEIREVFRERGAEDPALEQIMLQTTLEGVVATEAAYGDSLPLEESRRWMYDRYDLPSPEEPLPVDSPTRDDPRLRAAHAVSDES